MFFPFSSLNTFIFSFCNEPIIMTCFVFYVYHRLLTHPLFQSMLETFVGVEEWYVVNNFNHSAQTALLKERITGILLHVKGERATKYRDVLEEICLGYNIFLKEYVPKLKSSNAKATSLEKFYETFWHDFHHTEELEHFIEFFEFLQIKSYSEAICESVGSMMNMATGN